MDEISKATTNSPTRRNTPKTQDALANESRSNFKYKLAMSFGPAERRLGEKFSCENYYT